LRPRPSHRHHHRHHQLLLTCQPPPSLWPRSWTPSPKIFFFALSLLSSRQRHRVHYLRLFLRCRLSLRLSLSPKQTLSQKRLSLAVVAAARPLLLLLLPSDSSTQRISALSASAFYCSLTQLCGRGSNTQPISRMFPTSGLQGRPTRPPRRGHGLPFGLVVSFAQRQGS
jgi:hypothetical protein